MEKLLKPLKTADYPLTIVKDLGMQFPSSTSKQRKRFAVFICPYCGKEFKSEVTSVKGGRATKCKSCSIKNSKTTHGESKSRLHNIWVGLRKRCSNANSANYQNYGARGITVCTEWDDFTAFRTWSLANGYADDLSIDRKNNDLGYSPSNCRWTDRETQARNTRLIHSTNTTGFRGVYLEGGKFVASIGLGNKSYRIGLFPTKEDAAFAYDSFVLSNGLAHTTNGVTL